MEELPRAKTREIDLARGGKPRVERRRNFRGRENAHVFRKARIQSLLYSTRRNLRCPFRNVEMRHLAVRVDAGVRAPRAMDPHGNTVELAESVFEISLDRPMR